MENCNVEVYNKVYEVDTSSHQFVAELITF